MGQKGWLVLTWIAAALAVMGLVGALWAVIADERWYRLAMIPLNLAFWYWVGMGAYRRSQEAG